MVAGDLAVAFEHVDLVFPIVRVKRRVAFGLKLEQAHGKIRRTIIPFDQPPHLDALSTLFLHAFKLDFHVMNAFEAHIALDLSL